MEETERDLIRSLIRSEAFARLQEVSFLGAIDYYNFHKSRDSTWHFSRSDHTIGVLLLSQRLIDSIGLSPEERLYVIAASICHDLGHSPFSHSTERAFKKINPKINHRVILEFILSDSRMGVSSILSKFGLNDDRVLAISLGTDKDLGWIFHNPINIDTLDGIFRFMISFRLLPPFDVPDAINSLSELYKKNKIGVHQIENLDRFWDVKGAFYDEFLKHGAYARFENSYINLVLSKKTDVGYGDFLKSDRELAHEIGLEPDLYYGQVGNSFELRETNFDIDRSVALTSISDLYRRYIRTRGKR